MGRNLPCVVSPVPSATIVCIGGMVADRVVTLDGTPVPGTSNPGSVVSSPGGVARNVAENLARIGHRPCLVSVIGDDTVGTSLVAGVRAVGVDARGVRTTLDGPTAEYLAILAPDGELVLGVAVMSVLDALTEADVDAAWPGPAQEQAGRAWVVADCNLRPEVLAHALRRARADAGQVQLVVVAVSAPKIVRLPADLGGTAILFCTRDEAEAWLAGPGGRGDLVVDPATTDAVLAAALCAAGVRNAVITKGAGGALAAGDGFVADLPADPVPVVDVTGGGDALVAGTIAGLAAGEPFEAAVRRGIRLAGLTVAVHGAVRSDLAAAEAAYTG